MNNMKKAMVIAGTSFAFFTAVGIASNQVGASEYSAETSEWVARTVEQVQTDLATDGTGAMSYTVKWGDTLSVIAEATKISLDSLIQINEVTNANLIYPGTVMVLSADQTTVSVSDTNGETQTYEVQAEAQTQEAPAEAQVSAPAPATPASSGSTAYSLTVEATAYSYQEAGLTNFTADGTNLLNDPNVIAVDPSVIPLGTLVEIPGYGVYRAADTGGAIVGNKIDIHFNSVQEALNFGRRTITINILN